MVLNHAAVERCVHVLDDVTAGAASDLATLSVAVRELRNVIEATGASGGASAGAPTAGPAVRTNR